MPKDPTTKTSTAAPPPKKPPVVHAEIFTPKPPPDPSQWFNQPTTVVSHDSSAPPPKEPPTVATFTPKPPSGLPPNVKISSPAQAIANRRIPDISDDELLAAFKDKPLYVLDRVNWPKLKSPYRKRLENLINQDPALKKILDYVLPVYPQAALQPQAQAAPAAPPLVTAEEFVQPEAAPKKEITAENAPAIEKWMNGLKNHVYNSFAQSANRDVGTSRLFTRNLLSSLALYRGGLAGFYLSEGSKELIFSALGPIGDAFRTLYEKDVERKMSWMKNPLNPDAIYYYLNSLPNQMAFKLMYLPVKATFGILARGGAPLISKVYYQRYGQTRQSYIFTPLLRATQFSNKLADGADKLSGVITDDTNKYWGEKSPYNQYIKNKNYEFSSALSELKSAKLSKNKDSVKKAQHELRLLLNEHDGFYRYYKDKNGKPQEISKLPFWRRTAFGAAGVSRAVFKNGLKNFSRRARRASRDPITGIFALIAGTLVDIIAGIGINILRVAANRVIDLISQYVPGINTARATITEFFTSNRWLQTARIGGATGQAFLKGTFSMTTASSIYGGASIGDWIANALGLPAYPFQVIGGGIGATFGSIYTTSLKMAANPEIMNWIYKYDDLLFKATDPSSSIAQQNFYRGELKKNFLNIDSRIANFRPGPLSNFAKWLYEHPYARLPINGLVIANLGVKFLGWNPWIAYPSLIAGDWLWQTRGAWSNAIARWFPTTPLGRWIGNQALSIQTWFTEKVFMRPIAWETSSLLGKMPVKWALRPFWQGLQNIWSKAQPYLQNFFNPGFFLGAQFLGPVFMGMGIPFYFAYPLGALAGTGIWWGTHAIYSAIAGKGAMSLAKWSAAGWVGYFAGLIAQGLLSLIGVHGAWMQFLPLAGSLIATVGIALIPGLGSFFSGLLINISYFASNAAWALGISSATYAAGLAVAATVASIAAVAGLTVFFAYTIYAGFWIPMKEFQNATEQSPNFYISNNCTKTDQNKYYCCASFNITYPVLNATNFLYLETYFKPGLTLNLNYPEDNTDAWRDTQSLNFTNIGIAPYSEPISSNEYALGVQKGETLFGKILSHVDFQLSTPTDQNQNLFEIMSTNPSVVRAMQPFFEIIVSLAKEVGQTHHLIVEYEAQLTLFKEQKELVDKLIRKVEDGNLDDALTTAQDYLDPDNHPMGNDPCPAGNECPEEKQGLKQLYDLWQSTVKRYINTIKNYQSQTDPDLSNFLNQLEQDSKGLEQQIELLPDIIDQMKEIQKAMDKMTPEEATVIINTNFLNFANMTPQEQKDIWDNILNIFFPEVFNENGKFYLIPEGTRYRACVNLDYSGPIPGNPQNFCSAISYTPSFWGANTGYAKSCTTFTPK